MDIFRPVRNISKYWWLPLVTGIVAIGLGIWTLVCPAESIEVLAYIFAGCLCAAGVLNLAYAILSPGIKSNWGWAMAIGLLDLIAGIWMFCLPPASMTVTFMFIAGIWLLVVIINSICEACAISAYANNWLIWMLLVLFASLVLCVFFLSGPIADGVAVWLWLGFSLIVFGIYRVILSLKIKKINDFMSH
ncbi:MAG: DUF308 domain-containing protein [Candidatus Amulumruptor caecigallinarius]|nr:DUF308 domain-containing protein [Candidatus Amulumruptor caecigallinarius]